MQHIIYYTDIERSQKELQEIAKQIRANNNFKTIEYSTEVCTTYENTNLGLTYYIKDNFGYIKEIWEVRNS